MYVMGSFFSILIHFFAHYSSLYLISSRPQTLCTQTLRNFHRAETYNLRLEKNEHSFILKEFGAGWGAVHLASVYYLSGSVH